MSPEMIGAIGIVIMIILLFSGMWIGASMTIVGLFGYAALMGFNPAFAMVSQIPFTTIAQYSMSAIPLFIFMGIILYHSGVGADLYYTAYKWLGHRRGGLAMATVVACASFAAITGISAPALVTMGKVAVPEMRKYKYDDKLATGSIACSGTMSILIPPSMAFILYGILTEQSVGKLFMAGILPGILLTFLFICTVIIITRIHPESGPAGPKTIFTEKIKSLKGSWACLLLFILIIGGIYGGIFTPTEAGAIGSFVALLIAIVTSRMDFKKFVTCLLESGKTSAMVFFLMMGGYLLQKFLAVSELPKLLSTTIAGMEVPSIVIMIGIVILYLILGMFLDIFSAIIITVPIIFPIITALGYDPIWFGVIITILIEIGLVSPPVGLDVYILSGVIDVPLFTIFRGVAPFVVAMLVCIIILMIFPQIALIIPNLM